MLTNAVVMSPFGRPMAVHFLFEILAWIAGFILYRQMRGLSPLGLERSQQNALTAFGILGAAIGAKLLGLAEHSELWAAGSVLSLLAAKSILGALLGGTLGVELTQAVLKIKLSTGDAYVFPLIIAMMIGRFGCFFAGVSDGTWGSATGGFWGLDGGDGVLRHPTPVYEIWVLGILGLGFYAIRNKPLKSGMRFQIFMAVYCAFRFAVEFIKPVTIWLPLGLSILQICALCGVLIYASLIIRHACKV